MATINGKPIGEIFADLAVGKAPDKLLLNKYPYYKIDSYYHRVDSVVGMDHYNIEVLDRGFSTIRNGQQIFTVTVRLFLIDDEGKVICYRDGIGSKEVTYNDNDVEVNLKNLESNAKRAAIKDCWHEFNIFGRRTPEQNEEQSADRVMSASNTKDSSSNVTAMHIVTAGKMLVARKDNNTGKPVYKVRGYEDGCNEKLLDVIFYPNIYAKCEKHMGILAQRTAEQSISFSAKLCLSKKLDGIPQYIFKGFVKG